MKFSPGSVGETLQKMQGVWHDHIQLFELNGQALTHDPWSGTPGSSPFDNLVYIEFDGENYLQTNVTFRGRPLHVRSFRGVLQDGLLKFMTLGPQDPIHVGLAAGPGRLIFAPEKVNDAWLSYVEPDYIELTGSRTRQRSTILYRNGKAVRSLLATGTKLSSVSSSRLDIDPRGKDGPVHEEPRATRVFSERHL